MDEYDLVIVGGGSGNTIPDDRFDDWSIGFVERETFGGTCLNRGCVPSKMFVHAADVAQTMKHGERFGVHGSFERADWPAIRDRVFAQRIDPIVENGGRYRASRPNTSVYKGSAAFVDGTTLEVGGTRIRGRKLVLAAGSRPYVPDLPGIHAVPHCTSDTIMRIDDLPQRLVILGGGVIAAEMAHVFDGLGAHVTIVLRGACLLGGEDEEVQEVFTDVARERFDVVTEALDLSFTPGESGRFGLRGVTRHGGPFTREGDLLLVATGRVPNSDQLRVDVAGIATDAMGRVVVDDQLRTNVPDVWAFGDLTAHHPLKHLANAEAKVVAHNLLHPDDPRNVDRQNHPRAVFGAPQVAAVGMSEQQLRAEGVPFLVGRCAYGATAYGWAIEDTTSFAKVFVSPATGLLLGAHIVGPYASTLIQPLIQAMSLGTTARAVAEVMYIHPALSEVVENALLDAR
ncbi:mycothione reductase [Humibacter sp.]|uniref:mycothione reductase n=1 Tax=Humibacter sp. TaxID=1940291 RepID=UPI002CE1241F|nr:mycothione reductase [Humibacter sp.]HVX09151.1 mycothione reductase [Humibacter sp.]